MALRTFLASNRCCSEVVGNEEDANEEQKADGDEVSTASGTI